MNDITKRITDILAIWNSCGVMLLWWDGGIQSIPIWVISMHAFGIIAWVFYRLYDKDKC